MYSKALVRLIDKLRVTPQKNKLTIVESKPWEEYKIGILPGNRGGKIIITEGDMNNHMEINVNGLRCLRATVVRLTCRVKHY